MRNREMQKFLIAILIYCHAIPLVYTTKLLQLTHYLFVSTFKFVKNYQINVWSLFESKRYIYNMVLQF